MKTSIQNLTILIIILMWGITTNAQERPITAVLNFDVQGLDIKPEQLGNLVRIELEKLNKHEVIDRYDIKYISDKEKINMLQCFGKTCMTEVGEKLKAEKVVSGSLELFGDQLIFTIRQLDMQTGRMEKSVVKQYLNLPKELPIMTEYALKEMFGLPIDQTVADKLSKKSSYESSLNNPDDIALRLSGPRMGFTILTGLNGEILNRPINQGGYAAYPVLSQFGYQFEKQYLNEGKYQALVEFVPMVTGIDQGLFIPSLTVMNGLRNNINGFEFAFGPTFAVGSRSRGFVDASNQWNKITDDVIIPDGAPIEYRMDSKGDAYINTGLILAFGKTIRSGKLNIPLNAYVSPGRNGWRFGFSFGFNAKTPKPKDQ
jgi:TolB-like protein